MTDQGIFDSIKAALKQVEAKMEKQPDQETGERSFFGEYLYARVVPENIDVLRLKSDQISSGEGSAADHALFNTLC